MKMTKEKFMRTFNMSKDFDNLKYIAVGVEGVAEDIEVIVNPRCNFESKKAYYEKAYNEKMQLKTNKDIKIVFVAGLQDIKDLHHIYKLEGL